MAVGEAVIDFLELDLVDGASTSVKRELARGGVLVYATLGFETGSISSSINASLDLLIEVAPEIHLNLMGGWIWYPTEAPHVDDPVWMGRIQIPRETYLRLGGTNRTGLTKTIRVEYMMEVP